MTAGDPKASITTSPTLCCHLHDLHGFKLCSDLWFWRDGLRSLILGELEEGHTEELAILF